MYYENFHLNTLVLLRGLDTIIIKFNKHHKLGSE
jgi:hypothetical protein